MSVGSDAKIHFRVVRFIYEAGIKLHQKSVPLATASVIYHKFYRENSIQDYDPYLIATTCLYLAGKIEEEHTSLRDIINVCYRSLHKTKPPLEMGSTYWSLRDSVAMCELFVLRMLNFKVVFVHPHKYLLHYLKFMQDWFEPYKWQELAISRTAWALLKDSYHGTLCLKYKPQHIAVAVLYFALRCHQASVPYHQYADTPWWKVFAEDLSMQIVRDIISDLIDIYEYETATES